MSIRHSAHAALLGTLIALVACGGAPVAAAGIPARASGVPRSGVEVIGAIRRAHPSRGLKSLSYVLTTIEYRGDTERRTQARVWASLPGRLRVAQLPTTARSGTVRNLQRLSVFARGRRVAQSTRVDLVPLLTLDLFAQAIDTTIIWLDAARVRYGLIRLDEWAGRRVWVVGAPEGDSTSAQFWVDTDAWRVTRIIQPDPRAPTQLLDLRFTDYTDVLDVPVPARIAVYRGGRLAQQLEISSIAPNPKLATRAFDLARWYVLD
jgi:hypothetical protein